MVAILMLDASSFCGEQSATRPQQRRDPPPRLLPREWPMPRTDVTEFMKDSRLGRVHLSVALLCGITLLADGYDVGVLGAVIPALTKSWHISHTAAGLLGSAGLAGMLFGGIGLGTVADRI